MTDGYQEAKQERNALERLIERIPGFRGFQDRELRRDVDKMQRESMATELGRLNAVLRDVARRYTDAGKIGWLDRFGRLDRRLDGLAQTVRFCDYGATGFFDPEKVDEGDLEALYTFDLELLDELRDLEGRIRTLPAPGDTDPTGELDVLLETVQAIEDRWSQRSTVISDIVQTSR
ncbi:MAG: hypothetical protein AAF604_02940 [Acidobacteriota bacterium]